MFFKFKSIFAILPIFWCLCLVIIVSCNPIPNEHWTKAIPEYTPVVIVPEAETTLGSQLRNDYMPLLDDITASEIPLVSDIENEPGISILLRAIALVPTRAEQWQTMWIAEGSSDLLERISTHFEEDFAENEYRFEHATIKILHTDERQLFAVQLNRWILLSQSSFAIEEAVRSYLGITPSMDITSADVRSNRMIINTPHFDRWLTQVGAVRYRPKLKGALNGLRPTILSAESFDNDDEIIDYRFNGRIPVSDDQGSAFVYSITGNNITSDLDRYIPVDAAAFAILNSPPPANLRESIEPKTALDTLLLNDRELYNNIAETLNDDFAYVAFSASGFLSVGEKLFIRKVGNTREFFRLVNNLAREGYIEREDETFFVQSAVLSKLIGSELADFNDFSMATTYESVVLSPRAGLTQRIRSDRSRRRVMYYDDTYTAIRSDFSENLSGFLYAKSDDYLQYLSPMLSASHYLGALANRFDIAAAGFEMENQHLQFTLNTYTTEVSDQPFEERWVYPLGNSELTGSPVFANVGGGQRDEVLFATSNGNVVALAADGTTVLQVRTGNDRPIGSPIVYDWYGNNQNVLLMAAGNKIYGWNSSGLPLPSFPLELDEEISAPITIADVSRNGRAEIIVATADRKIHVLDGRGTNISGWPQTTNATIQGQPVFRQIDGVWSVWAFAENGVFAWQNSGTRRSGYPVFGEAQFNGYPVFLNENIIAAGADGYLHSIGKNTVFEDTLATDEPRFQNLNQLADDNIVVQSLNVSNTALVGPPILQNLTIQSDDVDYRENMITVTSLNGSVFVYNTEGRLRFTQSMGQPAAENQPPIIRGIANRNRPEIIALAGFGRLYSWEAYNGERNTNLPTAAMKYPVLRDLTGDGRVELIAQTRDGLRAWTLIGR